MEEMFVASQRHRRAAPRGQAIVEAVEQAMNEHFQEFVDRAYLLPGATEVLRVLAGLPGIRMGVVTGNIQLSAWRKMCAFDMELFIDWDISSFGTDARDRADLLVRSCTLAQTSQPGGPRGIAASDYSWATYVGDRVADVQAAKKAGLRSVAVATGEDDERGLRLAGADAVLPGLVPVTSVVPAILG